MKDPEATPKNLLVIGAHAADFIWRAAGAIALTTANGGRAVIIALSYGERGESGELWKVPDQTIENVKRIRHEQAEAAAAVLGAEFTCFDLGDYPLAVDSQAMERLAQTVRDVGPHAVLTHTELDPVNPDHPVASRAAHIACQLAAGAGVASAFKTIKPPALYHFEPHQPELSGFVPNTFLDITAVHEKKVAAMAVMASQSYLGQYYAELAARRGNHARRASGNTAIKQAEAYQRLSPRVVNEL